MKYLIFTTLFVLTTNTAFATQNWKVLITNKTGDKLLSIGLTAEVDSLTGAFSVIKYDSEGKGVFIADGSILGGELSEPITLPNEVVQLGGANLKTEGGYIRFFKISDSDCLVNTKNLKSFRAKNEVLPCGFFVEGTPPGGFTGSN